MISLNVNIIPSCDYLYKSRNKRVVDSCLDKRPYIKVSDEFKAVIVECANTFSIAFACKKFNKCSSTVTKWRNDARILS